MCRVQWAQCGWSITQLCWFASVQTPGTGQCCVPGAAVWAVIPWDPWGCLHKVSPCSWGQHLQAQPWKPADVFPNTLLLKAPVKPEMQWLPRTFLP